MESIELSDEIRERLRSAERMVVFSGAGVSRESGLNTFRGAGGLWERMRPEELATPEAFRADPVKVWRWYAWRYGTVAAALPNPAHVAIARLESGFPSYIVVTQNVDGLHQRAGSRNLLELHGTIMRAVCERCGRSRDMGEAIAESPERPPLCSCGGRFRPAVVWFGEALPEGVFAQAHEAAAMCDVFLSVGTSGTVWPAAGLIELAHGAGALFIEVNPEPTPFSRLADLRLAGPAGETVPMLAERIEIERSR
ncbi:MAG: NAD-dependent deacetylase [Acidobacteriota bacterium]|jgi:NAD-dependent deacetylase|nr:NAD-dependent deacetylase [Acidobacteriota bacterium]